MNDRRLSEEAATWYLDMQESPDAHTEARFMAWLRRSPQHVAEYMAMARIHGDLRAALAMEGMSVEELRALAASESSVVALRGGLSGEQPSPMNRLPQMEQLPRMHGLPQGEQLPRMHGLPQGEQLLRMHGLPQRKQLLRMEQLPRMKQLSPEAPVPGGSRFSGDAPARQRLTRNMKRLSSMAAALVVGAGFTAAWPSPAEPGTRYAAGADVREVTLDDDTVVQLSPESAMVVRFDSHARHIELLQGRASFDIGKDPVRPMKVTVGRQQIDDIGTVFDVQRSKDAAQVTVVSGQVSVWQMPAPWLDRARARLTGTSTPRERIVDLRRGETARIDADGHLAGHGRANVATATQWLPDDIRFHDATVAEVARRFNAYSAVPLVVDDTALASKRISGVFHARDPEAFIAYLGSLPHVQVDRTMDRVRFAMKPGARRL